MTETKHNGKGMCIKCYSKKYREKNPEKIKNALKKWREENPEEHKENYKNWAKKNPGKRKKSGQKYRKKNIEKIKKQAKKCYKKNSEKIKKRNKNYGIMNREKCTKREKRWKKNNLEKVKGYFNNYIKQRKRIDIHFKLKMNISSLIRARLRYHLSSKNGKSTFTFLPYTVDELKQHLEKQFKPWMNWNNWGNKQDCWNIDHIEPDCSFNYKSVEDEEFQKCWALKNLRPLDAIENIKKKDKIIT